MNRYQESLNRLIDYASEDTRYSNEQLIDDGRLLRELVDKQEKYKWHDLRKKPNDLPKQSVNVVVCLDKGYVNYSLAYHDGRWWKHSSFFGEKVIAWKYIEEFEDE